jgi:hypothetical protein
MRNWDIRTHIDNLSWPERLHIVAIVLELQPLAQEDIANSRIERFFLECSFRHSFYVTGVVCRNQSSDRRATS